MRTLRAVRPRSQLVAARATAVTPALALALVAASCTAASDPVASTPEASPASHATENVTSTTTAAAVLQTTVTSTPASTTTTSIAPRPEPEATPAGSSVAAPRGRLVIHGTGDVALDPGYVGTLRTEGYDYAWTGLGGLFSVDDLTVINMECAVSELGAPIPKAFNFRCDPESLPAARAAGVDVANLANNHGLDYGRAALVDSIENLRDSGIAPVGAGNDFAEAYTPAILEINGWTVAVLGFGGVLSTRSWLATEDRAGIASGDDTDLMVAAVEKAEEMADLTVVTVHWGRELDTSPRADDIARAEAMVAAGADIIFGHHQHRLNPLGWVDGAPVAWGLGNFVWPRLSVPSATTAVARVIVEPDGSMGACLVPAEIVRSGHPTLVGEPPGACELSFDPTVPPTSRNHRVH